MLASRDGRRVSTVLRGIASGPDESQVWYFDPAWSADGGCLAVTILTYPTGGHGYYEVSVRHGKQHFDLPGGVSNADFEPAWAPDSSRVVLAGGNGGLYIQGVGSKINIALTSEWDDFYESAPAWAPDGSRIAFASDRPGLYLIRPDKTGLRRLTTLSADNPSWSPDSKWLVFDDGRRIAMVNADATNLRYLTKPKGADTNPAWSPDGRTIAFVRSPSATSDTHDIWLMNADGRNQRLFLKKASDPTWAPR